MAVALPDIDTLLEELNGLRVMGRTLKNQIAIQRIKRMIDALRDDYVAYHLSMASLYCLTGEHEKMLAESNEGMRYPTVRGLEYNLITLCNAGYFGEARRHFDAFPRNLLESGNKKELLELEFTAFSAAFVTFSFNEAITITSHAENLDYPLAEESIRIFQRHGIDENSVLPMMDLAGSILRKHELIVARSLDIYPNSYTGTINISIPVNVSPEKVADLDWEFADALFSTLPDAPHNAIHIGFCCATK